MTLSIDLPEQALTRLRAEATRRGVSIDEVIAELAGQLPSRPVENVRRRSLSFAGTLEAEEDFAERSEFSTRSSVALPGEPLMLLADTGPHRRLAGHDRPRRCRPAHRQRRYWTHDLVDRPA